MAAITMEQLKDVVVHCPIESLKELVQAQE
jgi:hypothetical protein